MLDTGGENQNKLDSREKKIKFLVLGNDGVGKTSISSHLTTGDWSNSNRDSLGVSFSIDSTRINEEEKKYVLFNLPRSIFQLMRNFVSSRMMIQT